MNSIEDRDISERAEILRNWEDFMNKYMNLCLEEEYHEEDNPEGFINLGTAVNNMCTDVLWPKWKSSEVWSCDTSLLQYREGYGIMRLRRALAGVLNEFFNPSTDVDPNNIFCLSGVIACVDVLAHCLADPGDVFLAPGPFYGRIYTAFMQRSRVELIPIPIISQDNTEDSPVLTLEKVKKAFNEAVAKKQVVRGIFLINPSNPLGDIYSPELLMDIFNFCKEYLIIYTPRLTNQLKARKDGLPGLFQDFGTAGLRIGFVHTWNTALQNCLKEISCFCSIPFPVMDMTAKFLEDLDWCKEYVMVNQQRLAEMASKCTDILKEMGLNVRNSEAGFFIWVDFRSVCGSKSFEQEMDFFLYLIEKHHLYIVPGQEFFCEQPGWFRLTFTSFPSHVDLGLKRLGKAIKEYQPLDL